MAIANQVAFKSGLYANLPATKASGTLYFVTDKNLIIAGDGTANGVRFGGDIQMVADIAALTADTQPKSGVLYYAISENVLAYYNSTSSKWIQLNAAGLTGVSSDGTKGNTVIGISVAVDSTTGAKKVSTTLGNRVASVTTGSTDGTINVDGTPVSVKGLGSAAYTASTAYDTAGAASTAIAAFQTDVTGTPDSGKTLQAEIDALETAVSNIDVGSAIEDLDTSVSQTAAEANGYLNLSITQADGLITALSGSISADKYADYSYEAMVDTLIGSDSSKSVRTIANEELVAQLIPSTAAESLDTLQEIAAWIQGHPSDAAAMNEDISDLDGRIDTLESLIDSTKAANWTTAYTNNHTHSNKSVLDTITSTKTSNWDTASTNSHTHSNKEALDAITSTKTSNWDAAYTAITWGSF